MAVTSVKRTMKGVVQAEAVLFHFEEDWLRLQQSSWIVRWHRRSNRRTLSNAKCQSWFMNAASDAVTVERECVCSRPSLRLYFSYRHRGVSLSDTLRHDSNSHVVEAGGLSLSS